MSAAALAAVTLAGVSSPPASAHQASSGVPTPGAMPSPVPSAKTPQIDNGSVRATAQVGNTMVVGGDFTSIGGVTHNYLAAFNATTGVVSATFNPNPNAMVSSVMPGPNDHTVYIGGQFTQVNGTPAQFVAEVDTNTGAMVPGFASAKFDYGEVKDMAVVGNRLYVAGFFSKVGGRIHAGIASLNATTGSLDPFMNVQFAGHHNQSGGGAQGYIGPWSMDVTPDGRTMVVIGNFKQADGLLRDQVAVIDLTGASAVVNPNWATTRYSPLCFSWAFDSYVRGVSFSPDGSYFVVNATGGGNPGTLCDAASRFETYATGTDIQPTWVDETGGDTLWAVTITDDAIYIGGHNRWQNNPLGADRALAGAVPRPGLAALDPVSGRPLKWNPGHNPLGAAVYALLATPTGLWMGYDANWVGNYQYKRMKIAFFPYAGGTTLAATTTASLPGNVFLGGTSGSTNVLYRVAAGGPAIASQDNGPSWAVDTQASPSPYHNSGSSAETYSPAVRLDSSVPAGTPLTLFDHYRWSQSDFPAMDWQFPVAPGTNTQVRLYFANRCTCTDRPGDRRFNVQINGQTVLLHYDIVADVGDDVGVMKTFNVTVPATGKIDILYTHYVGNPMINGVEIINADGAQQPPSDALRSVRFNGSTAQAPQVVAGSGIPWTQTKAAFEVGHQVFYAANDNFLYSVPFDGTTFGTPQKIDPYKDPAWVGVDTHDGTTFDGAYPQFYTSQIQNLTAMTYAAGKVYFTLANDPALHWAWFSPDSGIIDQTEFTASSSVDFRNADGMFISGGFLYYVNRTDGGMYAASFANGAVTGSPTLVNGTSTGGIDWRSSSMFLDGTPPPNQNPTAGFTNTCTFLQCSFDASGSSDPDGTIASYAWNFGDNSTGSGVSPQHAYAAAGHYTVTLTITDDRGGTATLSQQYDVTAPPNQSPTAVFSSQCTYLACSFDGLGSVDPDGSIASYSWDFGDSTAGTGAMPQHTYGTAATYTVTLTVTDNQGATSAVSHDVVATPTPPNNLAFVGAAHSVPGSATFKQLTVPAGAHAGDTMVLYLTRGSTASPGAPSGGGWTQADTFTNGTIITTVWTKPVGATDPGSTVRVDFTNSQKAVLTLGVYSGVNAANPIVAVTHRGETGGTAHLTSAVVAEAGDWVISYWSDKSAATSSWTVAAGLSQRDQAIDNGASGRYGALLADSGGTVSAGSYGGFTSSTDAASDKADMVSIALRPAS